MMDWEKHFGECSCPWRPAWRSLLRLSPVQPREEPAGASALATPLLQRRRELEEHRDALSYQELEFNKPIGRNDQGALWKGVREGQGGKRRAERKEERFTPWKTSTVLGSSCKGGDFRWVSESFPGAQQREIMERGQAVEEEESEGSPGSSSRRGTGAPWPAMRNTGRRRNAWKKVIRLTAAWNSFGVAPEEPEC